MIGYIRGTALNSTTVVDASGVGWKVHTTWLLTAGEPVEVFVSTVVREDAITLYGFPNSLTQECFDQLRRITGVGPSIALAVLTRMPLPDLAAAVTRGDQKALTAIKGVGARVAARIVADAKLPDAALALAGTAPISPVPGDDSDELVEALVSLGLSRTSAQQALAAARASGLSAEPDILAAALRHAA